MIITCEFPSLHVNSLFILTFFSLYLSTSFMMKILIWDQIDFIWESSWLTNITSFGQSSWNHEEGQQQGSFKTSTGFIGQDFNWPGWSFKILDWFLCFYFSNWLKFGTLQVDRKLVKQTVMTSVYGVTFVGAREQIKRRLEEKGHITDDRQLFAAACYAAKVSN